MEIFVIPYQEPVSVELGSPALVLRNATRTPTHAVSIYTGSDILTLPVIYIFLLLSWVYISFLLRVYFHISGTEFYLGGEGKLCSNSLAIGDLNECKLAVSQLANTGLDIQFSREESALDWPFGCYEVGGANWTNAYWNSNSAGKSNPFARPICKGYSP